MKMTIVIAAFLFLGANTMADLKPGDPAPDFEMKDSTGKIHKLTDYTGQIVALYFYPKDDTPGCTKQACSLRDGYSELGESKIVILGVSYDDSDSHKAFISKYNLPFPLLSDNDKAVAKAYGTKGMIMTKRHTFIIGADGKILAIINKVNTGDHARQILETVKGATKK